MRRFDIMGNIRGLFRAAGQAISFSLLLSIYLTVRGLGRIARWRIFPGFVRSGIASALAAFQSLVVRVSDARRVGTISRIDLIDLSIRNMSARKTRTFVTVGGMMIGIGAIVFLVSIGYGLQQLVITRVARLEEMRQFDISPQAGGKVRIDDGMLSDLSDIPTITSALPLIAVVGRVNYNDSVSDMAAYGVTTEYLRQSAIQPVRGGLFDSDELTTTLPAPSNAQAPDGSVGVAGEKIRDVDVSMESSSWIRVRSAPDTGSEVIGFTKQTGSVRPGEEYWGAGYESEDGVGTSGTDETGTDLGKWVKADVLLWEERSCDQATQGDCEDGKHMVLRDDTGEQVRAVGYFAEIGVSVSAAGGRDVVISDPVPVATDDSGWVRIDSESGVVSAPDARTVSLSLDAKRQAVLNRAALKVLGIDEQDSIGKTFSASFVVVGDLLADSEEKLESSPAEYVVVGVTPEEKTPVFYIPFIDVRSLGITNYSQVKATVTDQAVLSDARRRVEATGYVTRSVADTVAQINSLFSTAKTVLALLGVTALAVAALGMFNTLTVSLLERTREVGLMKAMGMKAPEVRELFLTESMIMGVFGGTLGLASGFLAGKLLGVALSIFGMSAGLGFMDISSVPLPFALFILLLSLVVGLVTGIYPARHATKISALNALRYE